MEFMGGFLGDCKLIPYLTGTHTTCIWFSNQYTDSSLKGEYHWTLFLSSVVGCECVCACVCLMHSGYDHYWFGPTLGSSHSASSGLLRGPSEEMPSEVRSEPREVCWAGQPEWLEFTDGERPSRWAWGSAGIGSKFHYYEYSEKQ